MKKEITVTLENEKKVVVKKLALKKYAQILQSIDELPKHLNELSGLDNAKLLEKVPYLIGVAYPDIVKVIVIATDLTAEEVDELDLGETTDLLVAFFEVNNFRKVTDNLKKMLARPTVPEQPKIS